MVWYVRRPPGVGSRMHKLLMDRGEGGRGLKGWGRREEELERA